MQKKISQTQRNLLAFKCSSRRAYTNFNHLSLSPLFQNLCFLLYAYITSRLIDNRIEEKNKENKNKVVAKVVDFTYLASATERPIFFFQFWNPKTQAYNMSQKGDLKYDLANRATLRY